MWAWCLDIIYLQMYPIGQVVVVRDGDSFVDSYIVHPPLVGQAEFVLRSKSCYVLIYFTNVPYT